MLGPMMRGLGEEPCEFGRVVVGILNWEGAGETRECLAATLAAGIGQMDVVVIDNGSSDGSGDEVREYLESEGWRRTGHLSVGGCREEEGWERPGGLGIVCVRRLPRNMGVGVGFGEVLEWASARGARWVWLLDQDSRPTDGALMRLLVEGVGRSAHVVVPTRVDRGDERIRYEPSVWEKHKWVRGGWGSGEKLDDVVDVDASGFSGMLVHHAAWERCGLPRSDFFVGYEDNEFCLRVRAQGFRIVWVRDSRILHRVGETEVRVLRGRGYLAGRHRAYRYFYLARNRVFTHARIRKSVVETGLVLTGLVKRVVKVVMWEEEKGLKCLYMVLGVVAGFGGLMGERVLDLGGRGLLREMDADSSA